MKTKVGFKVILVTVTVTGAMTLMSLTREKMRSDGSDGKKAWAAPASADTIKNPLKGKAETIALGKKIYATYCVVCHGAKGKGDGIAASGLNPRPADHTSEQCQKQSDGALYWKLTYGRPPMASYAKTLTTEQRWQVINYIRTLKAK